MGTVLLLVLGLVLCLPIAGLFLFRFYANQLVQQTEESLLTQASVLAAVYAEAYASETGLDAVGLTDPQGFTPVFPSLSLGSETIFPPRPDATPMATLPSPVYRVIGPELSRIVNASQRNTLAGYRLLDPHGNVIGGSAELGLSLNHVDEVARALGGETVSVTRVRVRNTPEPAVYSVSQGTRVRVFVAMPVVVDGDVVGAVYLSRTPNHIFRFLYGERFNLAKAALFVIVSTALIGFVFWRFVTRPIQSLIQRTQTAGSVGARWEAPGQFGTKEIENLSNSFQILTERLHDQQDALKTYTAHVTHELKSPLTAVKGAAELLRDEDMTTAQRDRFLDNIERDTARMEDLLASMRAFSLAEQNAEEGSTTLRQVGREIRSRFPALTVSTCNENVALPLHPHALKIILTHMLENAQQNGAGDVSLTASKDAMGQQLVIQDDGRGISAGNRDKVLMPFFTTRRDQGGTGMGLNIVKSVVEASGGQLTLHSLTSGAQFTIRFNARALSE
ncbi:HAMP domain-containing histidine kinase [Rhodobacteraceae bacterium B1Z28]|uniref:histidine kinase n=1 Tax=Ruegeria haliotis TaxID=2747601 RepID=A0ABX2PNQ4_9RHOB|nr:HAMP domain-containing histidine kinase [Ruegeria haliotis]